MGFIGIALCFIILLVGVWKQYSILLVASSAAIVAGVLNGLGFTNTLEKLFVSGITSFLGAYFFILLFGALFGKLMDDSGAAKSVTNTLLAKLGAGRALLAFGIVNMVLSYGGLSVFVILFLLIPLARLIFRQAGVAWYLAPAYIMVCALPASAMFPGALQLYNIIPTKFLGTDLMAAPITTTITGIAYLIVGVIYIRWAFKRAQKDKDHPDFAVSVASDEGQNQGALPNFWASLAPMIVPLVLINYFKVNITIGLLVACIVALVIFWKNLPDVKKTLNTGLQDGIMPGVTVGMVVGIAKVITATVAFASFKTWIMALAIPGLYKLFIVINGIAFMTGSGTGAMTMALEMFSKDFLAMGFNPEIIHRVVGISCLGLDTMPWNTFVIIAISLCGVSYRKAYPPIFMVSVVLTAAAALFFIIISGFAPGL